MIVILCFLAIIAITAFFEALFAIGIMSQAGTAQDRNNDNFTIVIAARNEANNIGACLKSLLSQSKLPHAIIVADDHSTDGTEEIVKEFARSNLLIQYVKSGENAIGKRAALMNAVAISETDIILTLDADCIPHEHWAKSMLSAFKGNKKFVSGPVITSLNKSIISLEYAETLFLMAIGAGAASMGYMFQASGASLIFYKNDFIEFYKSAYGAEYNCGDDVFFLQHIQKKYGRKSVGFNYAADSVVKTNACGNIKSWILQRVRWAAKSKGYSNYNSFIAGAFITLSNIAFLVLSVIALIVPEYRFLIIPVVLLKILGDVLVLFSSAMSWNIPIRIISFIVLSVLYPIFLITIALALLFKKEIIWKGRKIS